MPLARILGMVDPHGSGGGGSLPRRRYCHGHRRVSRRLRASRHATRSAGRGTWAAVRYPPMHLQALVPQTEIEALVHELLPLKVLLGDEDDDRTLLLLDPSTPEFLP